MLIKTNGEPFEIRDGASVFDLLAERELQAKPVVVELNGVIIKEAQLMEVKLKPGDSLEIVRIIGGG